MPLSDGPDFYHVKNANFFDGFYLKSNHDLEITLVILVFAYF